MTKRRKQGNSVLESHMSSLLSDGTSNVPDKEPVKQIFFCVVFVSISVLHSWQVYYITPIKHCDLKIVRNVSLFQGWSKNAIAGFQCHAIQN